MSATISTDQREAVATHRRRRRESGLVRVEVQIPAIDAALVRDLAAVLRGEPKAAQTLRTQLRAVVAAPRASAVFDIFGSDLPDSVFDNVFEHDHRGDLPRDIEL
jgi:hypothetical protein